MKESEVVDALVPLAGMSLYHDDNRFRDSLPAGLRFLNCGSTRNVFRHARNVYKLDICAEDSDLLGNLSEWRNYCRVRSLERGGKLLPYGVAIPRTKLISRGDTHIIKMQYVGGRQLFCGTGINQCGCGRLPCVRRVADKIEDEFGLADLGCNIIARGDMLYLFDLGYSLV